MKLNNNYFPVSLTIAGSDSGGGAGIQADLRTFSALGVFGTSVITALTAQNPRKVLSVMPVPSEILQEQLRAIFAKFAIRSAKTGMLFNASIIKTVSAFLKNKKNLFLVVDPVMISTSGVPLLKKNAINTLANELFHIADWLTPNAEEAQIILGKKIKSLDDAIKAANDISVKWNCSVVLKGGHRIYEKKRRIDVLSCKEGSFLLSAPNLDVSGAASHGTGCTFSAALTANFAKNMSGIDAVIEARKFVHLSLLENVLVGRNIRAMFPPKNKLNGEIQICKI